MSAPKQKLREVIFLLLCCFDLSSPEEEEVVKLVSKELKVAKAQVRFCLEKAGQIQERQIEIDEKLTKTIKAYEFNRIHWVERNILRLGIYELLYEEKIPAKVAIAEAMRLGKKFGTPASVAFINAIMDHLYKVSLGEKPSRKYLEKSIETLIDEEKIIREHDEPDSGKEKLK